MLSIGSRVMESGLEILSSGDLARYRASLTACHLKSEYLPVIQLLTWGVLAGWLLAQNQNMAEGFIPGNYIAMLPPSPPQNGGGVNKTSMPVQQPASLQAQQLQPQQAQRYVQNKHKWKECESMIQKGSFMDARNTYQSVWTPQTVLPVSNQRIF